MGKPVGFRPVWKSCQCRGSRLEGGGKLRDPSLKEPIA